MSVTVDRLHGFRDGDAELLVCAEASKSTRGHTRA